MIDPKELRIGNLIYAYPKRVISIISITPTEVLNKGDETEEPFLYDELEGIPLTPEILKKCGFDKGNSYSESHELIEWKLDYFYIEKEGNCFYWQRTRDPVGSMLDGIEIKYIHQLQNLYFAITGEELTINHKALSPLH